MKGLFSAVLGPVRVEVLLSKEVKEQGKTTNSTAADGKAVRAMVAAKNGHFQFEEPSPRFADYFVVAAHTVAPGTKTSHKTMSMLFVTAAQHNRSYLK